MGQMDQEHHLAIGEQLRVTREGRKLSLEHTATHTRIRLRYLIALETGDWSSFPSATQARGFLRAYCNYLDLDMSELDTPAQPAALSSAAVEEPADIESTEPLNEAGTVARVETVETPLVALGHRLRVQRELLGLSLEDVSRYTHLREHYLEALEDGALDDLPSPVQGRGMLKNYASFLGLDPEPLLLNFADGLQARLAERRGGRIPRRPAPRRNNARPLISMDLILAVVLGIVRAWDGAIHVASDQGQGSTFCLYLPLVTDDRL